MSHRHRRSHKHESSSSSSSSSSDSDSSCDSDTMEMLKEVARMLRRKLKKRHHSHKKVYRFSGQKSMIPVSPKSNSSSSSHSSTDRMDSDRENSSASDDSDVDHCGPGKIDVGGGKCVEVLQKSVPMPISTGGVSERSDNVSFSIQDKVTLLTSMDLGKMDRKIVLFYAPWCGHCKKTKPEYVKVAKKIGGLHAVNCDEDEEVATHFNIKGFPTIAYIQDDMISETYEGPRVASAMLNWVNKNKPKQSPKKKRSKAMYGVTEVAEKGHLFNSKWIKELTASTFGKNDKVVMFYAPWCGHCKTTAPIFDSVADAMKQQLYVVNCDKESELASQQGIQGFPTILYFKKGKRIEFGKDPLDGNRDLESIKKWITRHSSVAVLDVPIQDSTPHFSVPEINDEDSSVLQSNCIVMFHAPWCGHCKTTKPVFEKVAEKFKKISHKIKFGMVNGDNNPELKTRYSVGGYPTILHIKNGVQMDEYNEQREIDQMSKWVQQKLQK
jgi:protein disulfide-isomerase-like protein